MTEPIGLENPDAIQLVRLTPETNGEPFVETWNRTFTSRSSKMPDPEDLLSEPVPVLRPRGQSVESPSEVEDELGYRPDGPLVAIYARQGGGNDECWCETDNDEEHEDFCLAANNELIREHPQWVDEKQDEFDGTYLTHYFNPGLTPEQIKEFDESIENALIDAQVRGIIAQVDSMLMTPWAAIYAPASARSKRTEIEEVRRLNAEVASKRAQIVSLKKVLEPIDAQDFDKISSSDVLTVMRRHSDDFSVRMFEHTFENVEEYTHKTAAAQKLVDDAERYLPKDSPLYEKLLGDRGQGSYNYTEKVGRRNVRKTRTYDRGSELGFDVTTNEKKLKHYRDEIIARTRPLRVELERLELEVQSLAPADSSHLVEALEQALELGWQWDADLLPEVPKSFMPGSE